MTAKTCFRPIHKDVDFAVDNVNGEEEVYPTFEAAAAAALQVALSRGESVLDVLVHSKAGARAWGGDDAVEAYLEDPEASVFERFEIKVNAAGRVP